MIANFSDKDIAKHYTIIGGKATNLCELLSLGLNVPNGFVISTEISESFFLICFGNLKEKGSKSNYLNSTLENDVSESYTENIFNLILETDLPDEIVKSIYAYFDNLNLEFVSVRSSANMEDSKNNSFAGIFDTFLNVDKANLIIGIKKCWCSLFSKRAVEYYRKHRIKTDDIKLAVVIQQMVEPDSSGVCFTSNPVTGNANEIYIEAVYGLGEGIVSGKITPDSYLYDTNSGQLKEKNISVQKIKISGNNFVLSEVKIDESIVDSQKISDEIIFELAEKCNEIQKHFLSPQDIEFAVKDDVVFFLQSRPITT